MELQIELEAARADRDALLSEMQSINDSRNGDTILPPGRRISNGVSSLGWEQDKNELRATIARKDDSIDKLLTDLSSEKLSRAALERLNNEQIQEFHDATVGLQR